MPVQYFLSRAVLLLRGAGLVSGHSLSWRLHVTRQGGLRSHGLRLRLYGVGEAEAGQELAACLAASLAGQPCRWRIVAIDADGTFAVLARVGQTSLALLALRAGLARVRGSGARRLRAAQDAAQRQRRGLWRFNDEWQMPVE